MISSALFAASAKICLKKRSNALFPRQAPENSGRRKGGALFPPFLCFFSFRFPLPPGHTLSEKRKVFSENIDCFRKTVDFCEKIAYNNNSLLCRCRLAVWRQLPKLIPASSTLVTCSIFRRTFQRSPPDFLYNRRNIPAETTSGLAYNNSTARRIRNRIRRACSVPYFSLRQSSVCPAPSAFPSPEFSRSKSRLLSAAQSARMDEDVLSSCTPAPQRDTPSETMLR